MNTSSANGVNGFHSDNVQVPPIELLFLGTGTSCSIPHLDCLTAPPNRKPCLTCLSTLRPEGKKNIRRNTSAALRISGKNGKVTYVHISFHLSVKLWTRYIWNRTVVIDVGKNFQAAAVEWFPKYGLREIDAVIITHAHADGSICLFEIVAGVDSLDSHEWVGWSQR